MLRSPIHTIFCPLPIATLCCFSLSSILLIPSSLPQAFAIANHHENSVDHHFPSIYFLLDHINNNRNSSLQSPNAMHNVLLLREPMSTPSISTATTRSPQMPPTASTSFSSSTTTASSP